MKPLAILVLLAAITTLMAGAVAQPLVSPQAPPREPSELPKGFAFPLNPNTFRWRDVDDLAEGWDWSLPPDVKPLPDTGLVGTTFGAAIPGNRIAGLGWTWRRLEPRPGEYRFDELRREILRRAQGGMKVELHLRASTAATHYLKEIRPGKDNEQGTAPPWLEELGLKPVRMARGPGEQDKFFEISVYPIWHPTYHDRYLKLIDELGRSGIPQMPELVTCFVHELSESRGEEAFTVSANVRQVFEKEHGLTRERYRQVMSERLEAWARAFGPRAGRLCTVRSGGEGMYKLGAELMQKAYDLGMGQRNGFVEMFLLHCRNPWLGQSLDADGYLQVDESIAPLRSGANWGDENEEYKPGPLHEHRFGPQAGWPYRYREAMLRSLQMRRQWLWIGPARCIDGPLTDYVSLALGRTIDNTPDAWCYLRQSMIDRNTPVKNFERWLYQRDRGGFETTPAEPVDRGYDMPRQPAGLRVDHTARTGRQIAFRLDDRFTLAADQRLAVKITYVDRGAGSLLLRYTAAGGKPMQRAIPLADTGGDRTATFFLDDFAFASDPADDFVLAGDGGPITVRFVRVIKAPKVRP